MSILGSLSITLRKQAGINIHRRAVISKALVKGIVFFKNQFAGINLIFSITLFKILKIKMLSLQIKRKTEQMVNV